MRAAKAAGTGGHREVCAEEDAISAENAYGHFDGAFVGNAAARIKEGSGGVAKGLDGPLPVSAAAEVGTDQDCFRKAAGGFGDVAAIADVGLGRGKPGGVAGVVENGDSELGGKFEERAYDGVRNEVIVIDFDADEAFVFDVVADLFEGAGTVTRVDEAVTEDLAGEVFGDGGEGAVGFAKPVEGDGAFRREDGTTELVNAEPGGGVNEGAIGIDGAWMEAEGKVGMRVDDAGGNWLGEGGGGEQSGAEAAAGGRGGSH